MSEAIAEVSSERARPSACVLVFGGGKGGTGRTTFVAALATALLHSGLRVRLIDADGATAGLTQLLANASAEPALRAALVDLAAFDAQVCSEAAAQAQTLVSDPGSPSLSTGDAGRAARRRAVRRALVAQRENSAVDLLLVDAPAGIGDDAAALGAVADGMIVVADPYSLHDGQERRLLHALRARWIEDAQAPRWLGVLINRAPAAMEGCDVPAVVHWVDALVDRVAVVPLDADALREGHPHDAISSDGPATPFAHDTLRAFDRLLEPERGTWPGAARDRWDALAAAKTRELGRVRAGRELEASVQRKWSERWPELERDCRRLTAEVERLRSAHAEEDARQARLLEDLRQHGRNLRAALEAAESRASARRSRALASIGMGFACGALAAITATVWLAHGATREVIATPPNLAGMATAERGGASSSGGASPSPTLKPAAPLWRGKALQP